MWGSIPLIPPPRLTANRVSQSISDLLKRINKCFMFAKSYSVKQKILSCFTFVSTSIFNIYKYNNILICIKVSILTSVSQIRLPIGVYREITIH